ncbi:DUF969 domain-containing protein [Bariatricus massiliensis]|uniref:DUF969 domain-containing protein n=1 Tax=Bariatricus massiliensis TaxID=1745713 RepID=A0ABS8DKD3_9FIRM|nr:DUF969 family protein [Bariatricus massiliensis]MCB7305697.1 DUF969 domain-containing protein [Bariatricus massiliensis]MCB7376251.1 DUF969 domain-containing protein [Bariatricus massiliensis]MCB7388840.1 DUF969 domain-containing protein [Bariatricus massiliensis]MCB7413013.1 DUF969 domain-containing protein [Bariatricus massiliensis]MCQ5254418.1 DUF969 domain-containing protein [Bariatricus massiliensis]
MELIKLVGILIVIVGFALKLDSILIIFLAAVTTAFVGGLGVDGLLEALGTNFVANRSMAIFIMILVITGTLERNGLKEAAAELMKKVKSATAGKLVAAYGVLRGIFGAFNVGFGGVAGFVRPVLLPMAEGAVKNEGHEPNEDHMEDIKGMSSAMENVSWFFCQVLFVGGSGGILVQTTLASLGYDVELIDLAKVEIPIAIIAIVVASVVFILRDKKLCNKYYGAGSGTKKTTESKK